MTERHHRTGGDAPLSAGAFRPYVDLVDRSLVERVVSRHLRTPITGIEHLPSSVHEVFVVSSGEQRVVARFNDLAEMDRFEKEVWCLDRAAEVGVPGPVVLATDRETDQAFMIESYVAGARGDTLSGAARLTMWRVLGDHLRRIHSVAVHGFGDQRADLTEGDSDAGWRRYLDYNLSSLTHSDALLRMGVLDEQTQAFLRSTFDRLARVPVRFGLSHGDPSPWNLIRGDHGALHVLDWSEAHAHVVPHFDLGVILGGRLDEEDPAFGELLAGYGIGRAGYDAIRPDVLALRLLIGTDKVRWALDRKPDRLADMVSALQALLGRVQGG